MACGGGEHNKHCGCKKETELGWGVMRRLERESAVGQFGVDAVLSGDETGT